MPVCRPAILTGPFVSAQETKLKHNYRLKGFEFLVANLNQDDETTTKLRGELPLPEIMAAGMFMAKGPAKCSRKLGGQ